MYPGKADDVDEDTGILRALKVLKVPADQASRILLGATVSEMRFNYHKYISDAWNDPLGE